MKRFIALTLIAVVTALPSCRESPSGLVAGIGTVRQDGGECSGIWMLQADSGRLYELTGLAAEFQQPELRVRFTLKTRSDVASFCMRGATADVVSMTKL
jgi:hypothetical protein